MFVSLSLFLVGMPRSRCRWVLGWLCALALLPAARAQGPATALPAIPQIERIDSMQARVQGCTTCHGAQGQGTDNGYFPRIAGKPAGYLYNQLAAFRDQRRHYPPMNYLVAYLPDAYLREMAEHFARLRPPYQRQEPMAADAATLARGQALAQQGDPQRGIPSCMACHGQGLTGMEPGVPGLVGLSATYVAAQLTRWKVGERKASAPDCMQRIAARLDERDVAAVSAWLSRQPAPHDAAPEPSNLQRMPFACGSQR